MAIYRPAAPDISLDFAVVLYGGFLSSADGALALATEAPAEKNLQDALRELIESTGLGHVYVGTPAYANWEHRERMKAIGGLKQFCESNACFKYEDATATSSKLGAKVSYEEPKTKKANAVNTQIGTIAGPKTPGRTMDGPPQREICKYFLAKSCKFGASCMNWHGDMPPTPPSQNRSPTPPDPPTGRTMGAAVYIPTIR